MGWFSAGLIAGGQSAEFAEVICGFRTDLAASPAGAISGFVCPPSRFYFPCFMGSGSALGSRQSRPIARLGL
jgi:hypothetical protein